MSGAIDVRIMRLPHCMDLPLPSYQVALAGRIQINSSLDDIEEAVVGSLPQYCLYQSVFASGCTILITSTSNADFILTRCWDR